MQIEGYRATRTVHQGLYGPVLYAEQEGSGRSVAIQIFTGPFSRPRLAMQAIEATDGAARRLIPSKALVQAMHAHVQSLQTLGLQGAPAVLDGGALDEESLYVVHEWLPGQPIRVGEGATTSPLRCAQRIAACLEAAHRNGIYHLRLRPSQVLLLLNRRSQPRVSVLGLGLFTLLGPPRGTLNDQGLACLAPELRSAEPEIWHPGAADVYSLAALMRAMLGLPLGSAAADAAVADTLSRGPDGESLAALLEMMSSPDPGQRPPMSEVNGRLYALLERSVGSLLSRLADKVKRSPPTGTSTRSGSVSADPAEPEAEAPTHSGFGPLAEPARPKPPNTDPLLGQVFGNFRLIRRIGSGAMGTVYEAKHQMIEHRAAVKVLRSPGRELARRFLDEARAVNIVEHPTLVSIFEFGQRDDGLLYIVMEFLSGQTLDTTMSARERTFSERETLPLSLQIARALSVAHARGVIHRDLKPSNIMLVPDPRTPGTEHVKIVDFGIAKLAVNRRADDDHTKLGVMLGTLCYMAPEQYGNASEVDGKADVFALGVVLYEMLSGVSPFGEKSSFAAVGEPPPELRTKRKGISRRLSKLVGRMLRAEASQRPTMEQVADELASHASRQALLRRALPVAATLGGLLCSALGVSLLLQPPGTEKVLRILQDVRGRARAFLRSALVAKEPALRAAAARALGETRDATHLDALRPLLDDSDDLVARAAIEALGMLPSKAAGEALLSVMKDSAPERRFDAALALIEHPFPAIREEAKGFLRDRLAASRAADDKMKALRFTIAARLYAAGEDSYREELWRGLEQLHTLALDQRLLALLQLARRETDLQPALQKLGELIPLPKRNIRPLAAIARLHTLAQREPDALEHLRQGGLDADSRQILDLVLLDRDIDGAGCERLAQTIVSSGQRGFVRKLAAYGVVYCGSERIELLTALLDEPKADPLLKIEVAGALMQIVGPELAQSSEQYLGLISAYQSSSQGADRVLAIKLIEALPEDEGDELLYKALLDSEAEVRRAAAEALSTRRLRAALQSLPRAIQDANTVVREKGMRAILTLLGKLNPKDGANFSSSLKQQLIDLINSSPAQGESPESHRTLQVLARVLLLRDGDTAQLAPLRQLMKGSDESLRLLIIEVMDADSEIVRTALRDASSRVRFYAARRRFERRARDAIPVLRQALGAKGEEAIIAYWMLRALGEKAEVPARLSDLLGPEFELPVRLEVVQLLAVIEGAESLRLLRRAAGDPSTVVRRAVIRAAMAHYQNRHDRAWIDLLNSLASAREVDVSSPALLALRKLGLRPKPLSGPPIGLPPALHGTGKEQPQKPPPVPPAPVSPPGGAKTPHAPDGSAAPQVLAKLILTGQGNVRIDLAGRERRNVAPAAAAGTTWPLPPGTYVVSSLCNERAELVLRPGASYIYPIQCEPAQSYLQARQLRKSGSFVEADKELNKALRKLQGRENLKLYSLLQFERGEVFSDWARLKEAMAEWNAVWDRTRDRPIAELPTIDLKFAQLKSRVGRFTILEKQGNRCVVVYDQLHMHGARPEAFVRGKTYLPPEGQIQAGRASQIDPCKSP